MNSMSCVIQKKREDDDIGTQAPKAVCANWVKSYAHCLGQYDFVSMVRDVITAPASCLHCVPGTLKSHKLPLS